MDRYLYDRYLHNHILEIKIYSHDVIVNIIHIH